MVAGRNIPPGKRSRLCVRCVTQSLLSQRRLGPIGKFRGTTRATPGSGPQDYHLDPGNDIMPHMSHRTCLGVLALLVTSTFVPRASPAQFLSEASGAGLAE